MGSDAVFLKFCRVEACRIHLGMGRCGWGNYVNGGSRGTGAYKDNGQGEALRYKYTRALVSALDRLGNVGIFGNVR